MGLMCSGTFLPFVLLNAVMPVPCYPIPPFLQPDFPLSMPKTAKSWFDIKVMATKKRPVNIYRPLIIAHALSYCAPEVKLSTGTHWPFSTLYTVMAMSFKSPLSSYAK